MQITPESLSHCRRAAEPDIPISSNATFCMLWCVNGADTDTVLGEEKEKKRNTVDTIIAAVALKLHTQMLSC